MSELKACPFCGGDAFMVAQADHPGFYRVFCHGCHVATNAYSPETAAIAAWNRRPDDWQPIAAAPRDGTPVLVYAPPPDRKRWHEVVWDLPEVICSARWHLDAGFCVCTIREVTHWRPLPEGPTV